MEKKLEKLFGLQYFEDNGRLRKLIDETENRYGAALSDELLELVSAAGELPQQRELRITTEEQK